MELILQAFGTLLFIVVAGGLLWFVLPFMLNRLVK